MAETEPAKFIMITYTTSTSTDELLAILRLQQANHAAALTPDQLKSQGFVTVKHTYDELRKLNDLENHIIAKDGDQVIAYILAMTAKSRFDLPILIPMFEVFDRIRYAGKAIAAYSYLVVGQVCVAQAYRGQGILESCYATYKEHFKNKYDFAITEIATTNLRSLNAHKRIGFERIHTYTSPDHTKWHIVLWDWGSKD